MSSNGLMPKGMGAPNQNSYFSRTNNSGATDVILSPGGKDKMMKGGSATGSEAISQASRNMSVLNMKKSSARFLSPLNKNN